MIDEKKIDNVACKYANVYSSEYPEAYSFHDGFIKGIEWYKQNLWHDASEEPNKDAKCLVYISCEYEDTPEDNYREYTTSVYLGGAWAEDHFPLEADVFIIKWCYLSDIMPQEGGKP